MSRPILTLSQPQASALAHGLFRVVVLDADDPKVTGWKRMIDKTTGDLFKQRDARLEPGSRVLIASNGEWTPPQELGSRTGWSASAYKGVNRDDLTFRHRDGRVVVTKYDGVVGSAVVEAVVPIASRNEEMRRTVYNDGDYIVVNENGFTYRSITRHVDDAVAHEMDDLSDDLPWLPAPDSLVGKMAVLFTDPQVETA